MKLRIFLIILIVLGGCASHQGDNTLAVEKKEDQQADVIVNNNRDWLGIGVVAGTLLAGYGLWEYYKWTKSSKSHAVTSENSPPAASSTD